MDPAIDIWLTEFETILTQSKTEQTLYDFKQGFTKLDGKCEFDQENFNKIIKTLTAMANHSPSSTGHICVGVADNDNDAKRVENIYNISPVNYKNFKITGIEHEAKRLQGDIDSFFRWVTQKIELQPIDESTKNNISRNIKLINYYEKDVIIFTIKSSTTAIYYGNKYYQRSGANNKEIQPPEYPEFFGRFSQMNN